LFRGSQNDASEWNHMSTSCFNGLIKWQFNEAFMFSTFKHRHHFNKVTFSLSYIAVKLVD